MARGMGKIQRDLPKAERSVGDGHCSCSPHGKSSWCSPPAMRIKDETNSYEWAALCPAWLDVREEGSKLDNFRVQPTDAICRSMAGRQQQRCPQLGHLDTKSGKRFSTATGKQRTATTAVERIEDTAALLGFREVAIRRASSDGKSPAASARSGGARRRAAGARRRRRGREGEVAARACRGSASP
jgi:hypothetical protein